MITNQNKQAINITPLLERFVTDFTDTFDLNNIRIIGIHRGGFWLADWLQQQLQYSQPIGALDISFYRDDLSARGLQPQVRPSTIPFDVDDANIVLIDDVILSGRTVRAALNEIFDYGRPNSVRLACLIDIGKHELPIRPDVCASTIDLLDNERIELTGPQPMALYKVSQKESSYESE